MDHGNDPAIGGEMKSDAKDVRQHGADDFEQRNQAGRRYAAAVLAELKKLNFPGGLIHRAEEIEDPAIKIGFFAHVAELAIAGER